MIRCIARGPRLQPTLRTPPSGPYHPLGSGRVDVARDAPIPGRDVVDQDIGQRFRRALLDTIDHLVDALDDLPPLLRRERTLRYVDFGDRHMEPPVIPSDTRRLIARCQ